MKKLISLIICISLLWATNISYADEYTSSDKIIITQNLLKINKWGKYKRALDKLAFKYAKNEKVLKSIETSLPQSIKSYKKLNTRKSKQIVAILEYFDVIVSEKLLILINEQIEKDKIKDKETNNNNSEENTNTETKPKDYTKKGLYPGFTVKFDDDKLRTILAGEESYVYDGSMVANIEEIDIESLHFDINSNDLSNFKYSFKEAVLYVEWKEIKRIRSNDFDLESPLTGTLEFDDLKWFIIPKEQITFRLAIVPETIGYEKLWKFQPVITVNKATVKKAKGIISDNYIWTTVLNDGSESFQISPVKLNVAVDSDLNDTSRAGIKISANMGKNTQVNSPSDLKAQIDSLKFMYRDTYGTSTFKLFHSSDSSNFITGVKNGSYLEFDLSSLTNNRNISNGSYEVFNLQVIGWVNSTVSLDLVRDWIIYSVPWISNANNINANLLNSVSFGTRTY